MPLAAFNGLDFFDKVRVIGEGNYYPVGYILTDFYYPINYTPYRNVGVEWFDYPLKPLCCQGIFI